MSSQLMMADMGGGGQTIVANEEQSIRLEFYWAKSCFKWKYPRWKPVQVTKLLGANGLTDEMLEHELKLINDQVSDYYGGCMKCFVVLYTLILLLGLGSIAAQFALPSYRQNVMNIINSIKGDAEFEMNSYLDDIIFPYVFLIGGIVAIIIFLILMVIHRRCCSRVKYKQTMKELKEYIYGFELQNKYQLVKWVVKHTIDGVQFDIIVTPLQRENQLLKKPEPAFSSVSI